MQTSLELFKNPQHPCRCLCGTLAFIYGLNIHPLGDIFIINSLEGFSPYFQLGGRSNRGRHLTTNGTVLQMVSATKYRHVMRALVVEI